MSQRLSLSQNQMQQISSQAAVAAATAAVSAMLEKTLVEPSHSGEPVKKGRGRKPRAKPQQQQSNAPMRKSENNSRPKEPTVADLIKRIDEQQAEINELRKQLNDLKSSPPRPTIAQQCATRNEAADELHEQERRSKNIVLRNIEPSQTLDEEASAVRQFFSEIGHSNLNAKGFKRQRNKDGSPSPAILVLFNNKEDAQSAMKAARSHKNASYPGVFAHEDRTKAQQQQFMALTKEAKSRNDELNRNYQLDKPFRWIVRGNRIRCIDVQESRTQSKSVFVSDAKVKHELDRARTKSPIIATHDLEHAIGSGRVSASRVSTHQGSHHNKLDPIDECAQANKSGQAQEASQHSAAPHHQ